MAIKIGKRMEMSMVNCLHIDLKNVLTFPCATNVKRLCQKSTHKEQRTQCEWRR